MEKIETQCFICGNFCCQEQPDHEKTTFAEFDELLRTKAGYSPEIAKLKHKVKKCYSSLERLAGQSLNCYVREILLLVDKLHFWHLLRFSNSLKDVEAVICGFMLPRSQMVRLLNLLNREQDLSITFPSFDRLFYEVHKFKKSTKKVIQKSQYGQLVAILARAIYQAQNSFDHSQYAKIDWSSNLYAGVPNQLFQIHCSEFVLIQGIPFSTMRRNVDLSVLQLTDNLLLSYLPALQKMRDLTQLQIRNNSLSERGYRLLFNCMPYLQTLDVSGSNSEDFCKIIPERLAHLKTLYANETGLTDEQLLAMTQKLELIRVIYIDENKVTAEGVTELLRNKKQIMYASVRGNEIGADLGTKMQVNLAFKGGYIEY